jgi:hypothetical protein
MTEIKAPQYVETVVESLSSAELFVFSAEARREIDLFYSQIDIPTRAREQSRALSLLHSAEYALLPAFANPGEVELPPAAGAITVSANDARLALLKGDCSLIIWTHLGKYSEDRIRLLQISDLMVFGGDVSKFQKQVGYDASVHSNELEEYISNLDSVHRRSKWQPAIQTVSSGAILLQGTLWNLKLAVVEILTEMEYSMTLRSHLSRLVLQMTQAREAPPVETAAQEAPPEETAAQEAPPEETAAQEAPPEETAAPGSAS